MGRDSTSSSLPHCLPLPLPHTLPPPPVPSPAPDQASGRAVPTLRSWSWEALLKMGQRKKTPMDDLEGSFLFREPLFYPQQAAVLSADKDRCHTGQSRPRLQEHLPPKPVLR